MTAWFGLLSSALCIGALAALLPAAPRNLRLNALIFAGASLIPLPGTDSIAFWLHALLGTPSATLAQLALVTCLGMRRPSLEKPLLFAFVLIAVEFYVLALGVGQMDVYSIGFRSPMLIVALFPLGLWLFHAGKTGWLAILTLDLLTYAAGLHNNLWDALFDPVVLCLAIIGLLIPKQTKMPS